MWQLLHALKFLHANNVWHRWAARRSKPPDMPANTSLHGRRHMSRACSPYPKRSTVLASCDRLMYCSCCCTPVHGSEHLNCMIMLLKHRGLPQACESREGVAGRGGRAAQQDA